MEGGPADYVMPLELGGIDVPFPLTQSHLRGRVFVDGPSFGITEGALEGYLSRDAMAALIGSVVVACANGDGALLCQLLGPVLDPGVPPDELVAQLLPFIGGYDARRRDGDWEACGDDEDCDHVSVCFGVAFEGIVAGLEI